MRRYFLGARSSGGLDGDARGIFLRCGGGEVAAAFANYGDGAKDAEGDGGADQELACQRERVAGVRR